MYTTHADICYLLFTESIFIFTQLKLNLLNVVITNISFTVLCILPHNAHTTVTKHRIEHSRIDNKISKESLSCFE